MTGCHGCVLCRLRERGGLTWAEQLRSPKRLHIEAEAALGLMLARRVVERKPGFPFLGPVRVKGNLLSLLHPWPHDRTRCLARQLILTHDCPMRREQQWPTIIPPEPGARGMSPAVFSPVGPPLEAPTIDPETEDRRSYSWLARWTERVAQAVARENPWGLLGLHPDGRWVLYGCSSPQPIQECATYSVRVWLVQAVGPAA